MINRAGIEDAKALAGLAIQMWAENDPADLEEEFRKLLSECEKWAKSYASEKICRAE